MEIFLNGEPQLIVTSITIAQLLADRGLSGKRLAVERNGEIVPKSQHADTQLATGDKIEIVIAVGGG